MRTRCVVTKFVCLFRIFLSVSLFSVEVILKLVIVQWLHVVDAELFLMMPILQPLKVTQLMVFNK